MKKTLTMAAVAATFAGMAVAAIETTNAGGYIEKSGDGSLVCNPFSGTATLADIGGLGQSDNGVTIALVSTAGVITEYVWDGTKWTNGETDADASSVELPRGSGFQLSGDTAVAVSGLVADGNVPAAVAQGNNLYGNAAPVAKTLGDLAIANFNPNADYVRIGTTKYILVGTTWYNKAQYDAGTLVSANNVALAPGQGFVIYRAKPRRGSANTTATLPGTL